MREGRRPFPTALWLHAEKWALSTTLPWISGGWPSPLLLSGGQGAEPCPAPQRKQGRSSPCRCFQLGGHSSPLPRFGCSWDLGGGGPWPVPKVTPGPTDLAPGRRCVASAHPSKARLRCPPTARGSRGLSDLLSCAGAESGRGLASSCPPGSAPSELCAPCTDSPPPGAGEVGVGGLAVLNLPRRNGDVMVLGRLG